jgi:hypothetical protein
MMLVTADLTIVVAIQLSLQMKKPLHLIVILYTNKDKQVILESLRLRL